MFLTSGWICISFPAATLVIKKNIRINVISLKPSVE